MNDIDKCVSIFEEISSKYMVIKPNSKYVVDIYIELVKISETEDRKEDIIKYILTTNTKLAFNTVVKNRFDDNDDPIILSHTLSTRDFVDSVYQRIFDYNELNFSDRFI